MINFGDTSIKEVRVGDKKVSKIALGETVVYEPTVLYEYFENFQMPEGWTGVDNVGEVIPDGRHLVLRIPAGVKADGPSKVGDVPQGPYIFREVNGSFDFAVALAEEPNNLTYQGIDLLIRDSEANYARFCYYSGAFSGSFRNDHQMYVWDQGNKPVVGNTSTLYGAPGWLRLKYDQDTSLITFYQSRTGFSGSWVQISEHITSIVPEEFLIHSLATQAGLSHSREQRIRLVANILAIGSDNVISRIPESLYRSEMVSLSNESELPSWMSITERNNGSVEIDNSDLTLSITNGVVDSHAGVTIDTYGNDDVGMLIKYQIDQGYFNAFWVAGLLVASTTDLSGATVVNDKWGEGSMYLMEMPAEITNSTAGKTVRLLRRSPVPLGQNQTGNREFDGYSMLVHDDDFRIGTGGSPVTCMRFEKFDRRIRCRIWLDSETEPTTWDQEIEDHSRPMGQKVSLSLGSNDSSAGGSDTAMVRFSEFSLYAIYES